MEYFPLIITGIIAGFIAGLLGVGGGLVVVPALFIIYSHQGISNDILMQLAIGTSLATIVITSASSTYAHHKKRAVKWSVFHSMTPGILLGAVFGALLADTARGPLLKHLFALFLSAVAIYLFRAKSVNAGRNLPGNLGLFSVATIIGTVSSAMGVGGGTMTVPFLSWCNVAIRNAVATSAALGFPIAIAGVITFIVTGWSEAGRPDYSLGYIHIPSFLVIISSTVVFAPLGAKLAHRLDPLLLRRTFSVLLILIALKIWNG